MHPCEENKDGLQDFLTLPRTDVQYVCTDVGFSSTSKGKPSLSNEKAVTDFVKLGMWVWGGQVGLLTTWSVITECAYLISHLHIWSD